MNYHSRPCGVLNRCGWCIFKIAFRRACLTYGIVLCLLGGLMWSRARPVSIVLALLGTAASIYSLGPNYRRGR